MDKKYIHIIVLIIFFIFIIKFGIKKGFNMCETYWIGITFLFYSILSILNTNQKILLIFIVLKTKTLYIPIYTITGVLRAILQDKFKTYRMMTLNLYSNYLNLRMNTENISKEPTIYVANYPSNYIEYLTHGLFCDKLCVIVHGPALKILKYIYGEKHIIPVDKGSFEKVQKHVENKIKEGYSIFSYIERDYYNRKNIYDVCELRSGMFNIAKNLGVKITPVCIDHLHHIVGVINDNYFNVKIGESFEVDNLEKNMEYVKSFFKKELKKMKIPKSVKK